MELDQTQNKLYTDICTLVEEARNYVASTANATMTLMYWKIGKRLSIELAGLLEYHRTGHHGLSDLRYLYGPARLDRVS